MPRLDREPTAGKNSARSSAPPDLFSELQGCRFAPCCPFRVEGCTEHPELLEIGMARKSRCWMTQAGARLELPATAPLSTSPLAGYWIHGSRFSLARTTPARVAAKRSQPLAMVLGPGGL